MKKIFFLILSVVLLNAGCKKILEVKPQSSITEATYFKNEGDFEPYLTGVYTSMRSFANNITYGTERSEELVAASNSRFGVAWSQIITASSGAVNYNDWYKAIGNCNLLLKKITDFPFSSADTKKRITAETYALRAYFYFSLLRIIGDAPLMLDAITDDNVPLLPRSPAVDVMKQVQSDLDAAIAGFRAMSDFKATSYPSLYRFAFGSTQALKADAKLWSAKVLGAGAADFNDAIVAAGEAEASGRTLNADFKNVTTIRAASNPEAILSAFFLRDESNASSNYALNALAFITIVQGALNLDSIPYANSSANGQGAYQISPKSKALFTTAADKRIPFTWVTERQSTGSKISWITKLPGTKYADDRISDNDIPMYRLADVFLMKAEAYAGINNTTLAITYLNKVRNRAGTGDYSGAVDKATVEKEILDERGREFYFENKRWYDLVRFHKGGTINVYTYVPNLAGKTTPLFWPLNTTVLANNNLIKQTEGYQ